MAEGKRDIRLYRRLKACKGITPVILGFIMAASNNLIRFNTFPSSATSSSLSRHNPSPNIFSTL